MKLFKIAIIYFLSLLVVYSATSCGLGKGDGGGETDAPETAEETVDVEAMNKELSEYSNVVVSDEDVLSVMKMMNARRSKLEDWPTYYEIVKTLRSTGKNTSMRSYRYEWEMENGRYLVIRFWADYTSPNVSADVRGGMESIRVFSTDWERIREEYKTDAEYLYKTFFYTEFKEYHKFLDWLGCHNLPDDDGVVYEIPDGEYDEYFNAAYYKYEKVPVKKEKALALKEGMTLYEAICRLESRGDPSACGNYHSWKTDDGFYVSASIFWDDFSQQVKIYDIRFMDKGFQDLDPLSMYDFDFYNKYKEAP